MDRARETVDPWIPWASRSANLEGARKTLQMYADRQASDSGRIYGIWLAGELEQPSLVGGMIFRFFDVDTGVAEIGCWLEPAGTGRGLITIAARHLIDWAFRVRGMHRIEWHCRTDNQASSNVARRLGLKLEATLRENYMWKGVRHDTEIWAVLAPEWE
jgi:RimJ/RimL family protein N-acetyltransferase